MTDKADICTTSREQADDKNPDKSRPTDAQDRAVTHEEKLEEGLEDSMDASDPASATQRGGNGDPVPSSGFKDDED